MNDLIETILLFGLTFTFGIYVGYVTPFYEAVIISFFVTIATLIIAIFLVMRDKKGDKK